MTTTTANGAPSNAATGSACLDLFAKSVRGLEGEPLVTLLSASWAESPLDTLKILFNARDIRGGKGEQKLFTEGMLWLSKHHLADLVANLDNIEFYGSFKDFWKLCGAEVESAIIKYYAGRLADDIRLVEGGATSISLAGKWAPSERRAYDREYGVVDKLIREMTGCAAETPLTSKDRKNYRQQMTLLRKTSKVIETYLCAGDLSKINFGEVPGCAMKKYRKMFSKKDKERFDAYMASLKRGEAKINGCDTVYPHTIVEYYINGGAYDEVMEAQWRAIVDKYRGMGLPSCMSIVDVSGSMSGTPMYVAIALGLILSEIDTSKFANRVVTFHSQPSFVVFDDCKTLQEKVLKLRRAPWGMNTNLFATFKLLQSSAATFGCSLPEKLFIFSDMQFDSACGSSKTNFQAINELFRGEKRPEIVFWNLSGSTSDYPVCEHDQNTRLVSGFSPNMLTSVVEGRLPTPYMTMRDLLDSERYKRVRMAAT